MLMSEKRVVGSVFTSVSSAGATTSYAKHNFCGFLPETVMTTILNVMVDQWL